MQDGVPGPGSLEGRPNGRDRRDSSGNLAVLFSDAARSLPGTRDPLGRTGDHTAVMTQGVRSGWRTCSIEARICSARRMAARPSGPVARGGTA